jgi:alcohol dehydrogenase class IV
MRFEFATATRIVFGDGTLKEIGNIAREFGTRALVVTGKDASRAAHLITFLKEANVDAVSFAIVGEPKTTDVQAGVKRAKEQQCQMVISLGGGSAIDGGKAIAAIMTNTGDLLDYLEVIGKAQPLANAPAPFIAIPTTAGTGAEVTRNAVLSSPEHQVKVSLRSLLMLPRVALIDPELTLSLSKTNTASTGLDTLTQLIEPYTCVRPNPITDALCVEGMQRAARSLWRAYQTGSVITARHDMCVASLFSGFALANSGLGAVHGFAAPIGGMFPAPHGAVCAVLLPHVMRTNVEAMQKRAPDHLALKRYEHVAHLLTHRPQARPEDGIRWIGDLTSALHIPPLRTYGITPEDFPVLIEKAAKASSMKANPIELATSELAQILEAAW